MATQQSNTTRKPASLTVVPTTQRKKDKAESALNDALCIVRVLSTHPSDIHSGDLHHLMQMTLDKIQVAYDIMDMHLQEKPEATHE